LFYIEFLAQGESQCCFNVLPYGERDNYSETKVRDAVI